MQHQSPECINRYVSALIFITFELISYILFINEYLRTCISNRKNHGNSTYAAVETIYLHYDKPKKKKTNYIERTLTSINYVHMYVLDDGSRSINKSFRQAERIYYFI